MIAHVFLDLDGTLIDPKPGITGSIRHALAALGREVPAADALTWCIGPPLIESFRTLLDGDEALAEAGLRHYRARYAETGIAEATVYPGIPALLDRLAGQGLHLSLATSKPTVFAERIVADFGFGARIGRIFGSELDGRRADKRDLLAHVLSQTGARPEESLMLGDRRFDIEGARANGVLSLGALWGYGPPGELEAAGADALAALPDDVPALLAELIEGRRRDEPA